MSLQAKNLLVFPCVSQCAVEINDALKYEKYVNLFGASSDAINGRSVFENYIEKLVATIDEPDFIEKFNALLAEYEIDFIFPAADDAALFLSEHRDEITAKIISSPYQTNFICGCPERTCEHLSDVAKTLSDKAENDLPGPEYTIDCFTDRHGRLRFCGGRQLRRGGDGRSVLTRAKDDRFRRLAEKINAAVTFRGAWAFQVKQNPAGEFVLLKVTAGIAGESALARNRGVNLPLLSLYDAMDMDVEILENDFDNEMDTATKKFRIDYRFDHVYVDFDDCLVVRGRVNRQLAAFLHDCINSGRKVHLLTRHADDINKSLAKYQLTGLFDDIIHIGRDEPKSKYVTRRPAIFIDDSFGERKDVAASGTAVFAPDVSDIILL